MHFCYFHGFLRRFRLTAIRLTALVLVFSICVPLSALPTQLDEKTRLVIISQISSQCLEKLHYRKQAQDEKLSSRLFDAYLKLLDPGRFYFTAEDVQQLEKYRFHLFEMMRAGDLEFVFIAYQRYLERLAEYQEFTAVQLKKGFDFTENESYQPDRTKEQPCENDAALYELWRKRLKNELLYYRLQKRIQEEAAAKAKPEDKKDSPAKLWDSKTPEEKVKSRLHDFCNLATQAEPIDILGLFLTAEAQIYGPHSGYSTPQQEEEFDMQFKLSLSGIGAVLANEDGYVKIVELVPGGPAERSGKLKPEDRIIAVAQEHAEPVDLINMSINNAVKLIRGPAGSKITLYVLSASKGPAAMPEEIVLERGNVTLSENAAQGTVETVKDKDGNARKIGVIKLNNFYMDFEGAAQHKPDYRSCSADLEKLLKDFVAQQVDAVVLDFRSNSGGSLAEAIAVSGLFLEKGPVVQIQDAEHQVEVLKDEDPKIVYRGPLVLLESKFSASSAEIVTGAMQDHRRALIVGDTRTYGKGTVLNVMDLSKVLNSANLKLDAGSLTYETAMFYRISGRSNQICGIAPDIVLPSFTEELEVGETFNENNLPESEIAPVSPGNGKLAYIPLEKNVVQTLEKLSQKRFRSDSRLSTFREEIKRFKKIRDRKKLSLNEETRLKEYYEEKQAADRAAELENRAEKSSVDNKEKANDLLLEETLRIAADYADILTQTPQQK